MLWLVATPRASPACKQVVRVAVHVVRSYVIWRREGMLHEELLSRERRQILWQLRHGRTIHGGMGLNEVLHLCCLRYKILPCGKSTQTVTSVLEAAAG